MGKNKHLAQIAQAILLFILIGIIAYSMWLFEEINGTARVINYSGITVAVCVLIISAVYKLAKSGIQRLLDWGIFLAAFAAVAVFSVNPVYVVIGAALLGLLGRGKGGGK
jgi:chromate transporter